MNKAKQVHVKLDAFLEEQNGNEGVYERCYMFEHLMMFESIEGSSPKGLRLWVLSW